MNRYAGKVRVGVVAIFCAAALAIAGLHGSPGRAQATPTPTPTPAGPTLFVADACTDAVTAYPAASNGDVSPLPPIPTGLGAPAFVAFDARVGTFTSPTAATAQSRFTPRGAAAMPPPSPSSAGATPA